MTGLDFATELPFECPGDEAGDVSFVKLLVQSTVGMLWRSIWPVVFSLVDELRLGRDCRWGNACVEAGCPYTRVSYRLTLTGDK
jgi:hypothetical protein